MLCMRVFILLLRIKVCRGTRGSLTARRGVPALPRTSPGMSASLARTYVSAYAACNLLRP